jgi:deoxycytidylate deaminase
MVINAGIARVLYRDGYRDKMAQDMLKEAGIETIII